MRIAIIGSGISGLASAWLLSREHEVFLYESQGRFGGHTNTVDVCEDGRRIPIDTGFIVFNERNYPHLTGLFGELGVPVADSDMSFSASIAGGAIEYGGEGLATLFAQPANLFRPGHWRMLSDILRFNRCALRWLNSRSSMDEALTMGDFLLRNGFSPELSERYLLPMAAAIWSAPAASIRGFPALSFLRFFRNHGLLQLSDRPQWRTVVGGGREYVRRILSDLGERALPCAAVTRVTAASNAVLVRDSRGGDQAYDQVVMACHADQALALLAEPEARTRDVLSAFRFQPNRAWLHSDPALMPSRRRVWSAWNYLADDTTREDSRVAVSYWMNRLQPLPAKRDYFVTLNPSHPPASSLTWHRVDYEHPVFDLAAIKAQGKLPGIQGRDGIWYCGAWTGNGFHEDGMRSAVRVANALGIQAPWQRNPEQVVTAGYGLQAATEEV
jgi:uncharacterized protein